MVLLKSAQNPHKYWTQLESNAYGSKRQCKSQGQVQHTRSPADEARKCRSGTVGVGGQEPSGVRALFVLFSPASSVAF